MSKRFFLIALFFLFLVFQAFAQEKSNPSPSDENTVLDESDIEIEVEEEAEERPKAKFYAYDETSSMFFFFNNVPREDFQILLNLGKVQEKTIFQVVEFIANTSTFIQIDMDSLDENEKLMYDFAKKNMIKKFAHNDIGVGIVINEINLLEGRFEGWGIVSHIENEDDVLSQIYYFAAEF